MRRCATFADENVLHNHNCSRSEEFVDGFESQKSNNDRLISDRYDIFCNGSWTIKSFHSNILNEHETSAMTKELKAYIVNKYSSLHHILDSGATEDDSLCINGQKLHTPPMLFGRDILKLTVGEVEISVKPCHAIFCWAEKHTEENILNHPYRPIRVPFSKKWLAKQDLPGSIRSTAVFDTKGMDGPTALDWTYSSDYCFTIGVKPPSQHATEDIITAYNILQSNSVGSRWSISASESSGIDYAMLRQQDLPILFYDECLLYQDDLEDCGEVDFEAKLRVMPNCWFLLNKMFLRVDGAILRSRETRLFHRFQPSDESQGEKAVVLVHGEITWREYAHSEGEVQAETVFLPSRTQPSSFSSSSVPPSPSGAEADRLSKMLYSRDSKSETHLLPVVTEREGITQYFTIQITTSS